MTEIHDQERAITFYC